MQSVSSVALESLDWPKTAKAAKAGHETKGVLLLNKTCLFIIFIVKSTQYGSVVVFLIYFSSKDTVVNSIKHYSWKQNPVAAVQSFPKLE